MRNPIRLLMPVLSLLPTPLLVFISSSSNLFLKNRAELQSDPWVLLPFAKLALIALGIGLGLRAAATHPVFHFGLGVYQILGPVFVLFAAVRYATTEFSILGPIVDATPAALFWIGLALLSAMVLSRFPVSDWEEVWALLGLALLGYESWALANNMPLLPTTPEAPMRAMAERAGAGPNIYHVILDEFQTDFFELGATAEHKRALGGFIHYSQARSVSHWSEVSIPSAFLGKPKAQDRPQAEYSWEAFNSRGSFLYQLKQQGYVTVAHLPLGSFAIPITRNDASLLDHIFFHDLEARTGIREMNSRTLQQLWALQHFPTPLVILAGRLGWSFVPDEQDRRLLETHQFLPHSAPVVSAWGHRAAVRQEASLPARGRYTLIYLYIPHEPLKLRADCSCAPEGEKTDVFEQSRCGLTLVSELVAELKRLARFEDSLILVHGDHGGNYRRDGDRLKPWKSRSLNTLVLFKPPGRGESGELSVVDRPMTLLDVPARVLSAGASGAKLMPFVENETLYGAKEIIAARGLRLGTVVPVENDHVPPDTIIGQDPPPHTIVDESTRVALRVSTRPADPRRMMPDFLGYSIREIFPTLLDNTRQRTLGPISIERVSHPSASEGIIVRQSPRPGSRLGESDRVVLYVSTGQ